MKAELEQLIALQNADTSIRKLKADIEAIPHRRAEIEKEFDQRAFEIRELEKKRDEARSERVRLETELAEARIHVERADRNLMSAKKQDEYTAAIREADAVRKQISQLETQVLEKMEIGEQTEGQLKEREPEIARLRTESDARIKAFDEETRTQQEKLDAARTERERLLSTLPKNMSAMYNRISARIRDGIAMAEARNGSCTACFMALRPQVMSEVRRGDEIITCENCNRILYYVPTGAATGENRSVSANASPEVATH
ncbi:MAG TPA: C4-type zinc ribbon domain-containing protein [Pyrinomonadaceae bacterium]|nr:C4-type zinc ribbon domain-containing protein [Pyrinomonadaceae bacterium]